MTRTPRPLLHVVVTALAVVAVATPSAQQALPPTPASVFGFEPGTDDRLAGYSQVVEYLRQVDAASERVTIFEAGPTTGGRVFVYAVISSPANLRNLDRLREINRRLAHPRGLSDADARALAAEGRAFVHIDLNRFLALVQEGHPLGHAFGDG